MAFLRSFLSLASVFLLLFSFASALSPLLPYSSVPDSNSDSHSRSHHRLRKRGGNSFHGRATFYATGLGACGKTNVDSDFIVALNQKQYEANKWCFKSIRITYGGKDATAVIVDECPGCNYGDLDLSPSLFKHFASEDAGVFYPSWTLLDGDGGDKGGDDGDHQPPPAGVPKPQDKPKPQPKPEDQPKQPPKSEPDPQPQSKPPPKPVAKPVYTVPVTTVSSKPPEDPFADQAPYVPPPTKPLSSPPAQNKTSDSVHRNSSSNNPPLKLIQSSPFHTSNPFEEYGSLHSHQLTQSSTDQIGSSADMQLDAYAIGGNLDTINQLIIAFGSLTAAGAQSVMVSASN